MTGGNGKKRRQADGGTHTHTDTQTHANTETKRDRPNEIGATDIAGVARCNPKSFVCVVTKQFLVPGLELNFNFDFAAVSEAAQEEETRRNVPESPYRSSGGSLDGNTLTKYAVFPRAGCLPGGHIYSIPECRAAWLHWLRRHLRR